jgi:hypothetical protein
MLAWLIINTILIVAALVGVTFVTICWLEAEKKLAKFEQSTLYRRVRKSKVYDKMKNLFTDDPDNE